MLPVALIAVAVLFGLLLAGRIGGARRGEIMRQWPAVLFAAAAILMLGRGSVRSALIFGAVAAVAWFVTPLLREQPAQTVRPDDPADADARSLLGVSRTATEAEIRAAYRAKMARAHPDRGGSNAEAARLTAARDRLLKRRR